MIYLTSHPPWSRSLSCEIRRLNQSKNRSAPLMTLQLRLSRHRVRVLALLLATAGGTATALALFGPRIGLGVAEQSVFYVWFGLTRTDLGTVGATTIALAICAAVATRIRIQRVSIAFANTCIILLSIMI